MKNYPFPQSGITTSQRLSVLTIVFLLFILCCRRPDQSGPNDAWCTSGINVLTVDDSNVPASIKSQIYAAPAAFTHVGHADYNANMPIVIIPYAFPGSFPFNTAVTTASIRDIFFRTGTGSVRDYFTENSWGQYNLTEGFIANVSTVLDTMAYRNALGPDWTTFPNIAHDICQNSNVNWAAIDANSDHIISRREAQICLMGAFGGGGTTRYFSVNIKTSSGDYTINASFAYIGVKRNNDPTKGTDDIRFNITSICHELCHGMFGLPDRYTGNVCGSGRVGQYDIMSNNCGWEHMSMYDKMKIGWIRPRILVKPSQRGDRARHCYTFPNSTTTPAALILWDQNQPNEYWIVENRYKPGAARGFDDGMPESGLAIWWVNETNVLSLVDARDPSRRPQDISYNPYADQRGVLFKNRTGGRDSTFNMQYLRSGTGFTEFAIRAPSPEGATMYAEF